MLGVTVTLSHPLQGPPNFGIHNTGGIVKVSIMFYAEIMLVQVLWMALDMLGTKSGRFGGWDRMDG